MQLSRYKALLFDLDKTLTDMKQEVTPATIQALSTLSQRGFKIGLCTGRHFATLKKRILSHFAPESTHVVSGGSQVITSGGRVLWQELIPYDLALDIAKQLDDDQTTIYFQTRDQIYGNKTACQRWHLTPILMAEKPKSIADLSHFPDSGVPIIVVHDINPAQIKFLKNLTQANVKIMSYFAGHPYADIIASGVTKVTGISYWCQVNGVKPEEIIGFGDSENDEEFLTHIGYAVAMGNAVDSVKKIADEVIGSCDEDGVARWVEQNI